MTDLCNSRSFIPFIILFLGHATGLPEFVIKKCGCRSLFYARLRLGQMLFLVLFNDCDSVSR